MYPMRFTSSFVHLLRSDLLHHQRRSCCAFVSSSAESGMSTSKNSSRVIINAIAKDRLGIVSDITGIVVKHGGNVGESQAGRLGSYFALMMMVSVPSDRLIQLKEKVLSMGGIQSAVFESNDVGEAFSPKVAYSGEFKLEGADNPGIVHEMTTALSRHGLSIDKMTTDQQIAPYGGSMLFKMRGICHAYEPLPPAFDIERIKQEMSKLGDSLNCEVTMENAVDENIQGSFYGG